MSSPSSIKSIFEEKKKLFSVEFFPPKDEAGGQRMLETASLIQPHRPDFVSITYGAGGGTRTTTMRYAKILREEHGFEVMPHLTCVGHTRDELLEILEDFANAGYPRGAAALLIIELDGPEIEVNTLIDRVAKIMDSAGASSLKISNSEEERNLFWAGRKSAFPAVGRISPDYLCMDGTIPRRRLPDMMVLMASLSQKYGLRVANVFHAGDGNLHPLILFDANQPDELQRAEDFGADILRACVEMGGVLTGEHGVGVEKRDLMGIQFTEEDMKQQQRLKCAFDADHLLNPGKVFPHLHRCAELGRLHVHKGKMPFPDLPRF